MRSYPFPSATDDTEVQEALSIRLGSQHSAHIVKLKSGNYALFGNGSVGSYGLIAIGAWIELEQAYIDRPLPEVKQYQPTRHEPPANLAGIDLGKLEFKL